jgi:CBS domain-containing protein
MSERGFRHIPILDDSQALIGLVSQSDVLAASASNLSSEPAARGPGEIRIGEIMTRDLATVDERANLRQAALHLQRNKFGCLPVVQNGKLRGIVTDSDFVAVAINLLEQIELQDIDEA